MIDKIQPEDDYLTEGQVAQLLRAINPRRVGTYQKTGNLKLAHVEAYELRAHLIRIFGPARWSEEVTDQQMVSERVEQRPTQNGGTREMFTVIYRSVVRLTICGPRTGKVLATYTEGAVGDATLPTLGDAHDMALKTSESQAFKRCCANLGDQFGLSLYRKGDKAALVKQTLLMPAVAAAPDGVDDEVADHVPEDETVTEAPDPRTTSSAANPPAAAETVEPASAVETAAAPSVPAAAVSLDDKAEEIRSLAVGEMPAEFSLPGKWINHLMGLAVKAKVQRHPVAALYSAQKVELRVLLEDRMKELVAQARAEGVRERAS
jgi:hypothetical protein